MAELAIRAAGGVVARDGRILLVHRPGHDDWSLPKGKLKRGEHPLAAAVREVREETGVTGRPGRRLPTARYPVLSGGALVPKVVQYWSMTVAEIGAAAAGDEVDEVAWLPVPAALDRLSYGHDREVVAAFDEVPTTSPPVVLVRRAQQLAVLLPLFRPDRLVSAPALHCRQTLAEVATVLGRPVELDPRFADDADPEAATRALRELATSAQASVVCGEDGLIASALAQLGGQHQPIGDGLVLTFAGDELVAADALTATAG